MEWDGKNPPAGEKARINSREVHLKSTKLSGVSKRCCKRCNKRGQSLWPQVSQIRNGHRLSGGLRVKEPKAVPREGADSMAPSSSPSPGASGARLGTGTWFCPSPNSPGLCSSPVLPLCQRMITSFLSSPSANGLQTPSPW